MWLQICPRNVLTSSSPTKQLAGPSQTVVALGSYQPDSHTLTVLNSLDSKCILIIRISEVILMVFIQSDNFKEEEGLNSELSSRRIIGYTVIPQLTKIISSGIIFFSRNVISRRFL